jgi:hypothetical protein
METMARDMIQKDPLLKTEFEKKKAADKEFASNPDAILNWFYSKTPYWDSNFNVYPIRRIVDRSLVDKLQN